MRAKLHNEETQIREKMKVLQKASEAQLAKTQQKMNILQTENTRLKREVALYTKYGNPDYIALNFTDKRIGMSSSQFSLAGRSRSRSAVCLISAVCLL